MTAHRSKPTLTADVVARFAAYHDRNPAWGIVHVSFDDGNWEHTVSDLLDDDTDEDRAIAAIHDALTPSQRRRLLRKVQAVRRG